MDVTHRTIEKAILKSQHCQRNWDLSKSFPEEDLKLLRTAVTQCPSKQNIAFYRAHFITNRDLIETLHDCTDGFTVSYDPLETTTNTQTLANLVIAFEENELNFSSDKTHIRNTQSKEFDDNGGQISEQTLKELERDRQMAIGVAAGYVNLSATLLGYETGCCACFDENVIAEKMGLKNKVLLLMGVGFKNPNLERRQHHLNPEYLFKTVPKQKIETTLID